MQKTCFIDGMSNESKKGKKQTIIAEKGNIYEYIASRINDINAFEQQAMKWKEMKNGSALKEIDAAKKYSWFADVVKDIKPQLNRKDVAEYYKNDLYKGFIATLLWGGSHTNHVNNFRRLASTPREKVVEKLKNELECLNNNSLNICICFKKMYRGGINHISGLGVSFFTKIFYFSRLAHFHQRDLYILDTKLWNALKAFDKVHNICKKYSVDRCTPLDYTRYCQYITNISSVRDSGNLEAYLYDHNYDIKEFIK